MSSSAQVGYPYCLPARLAGPAILYSKIILEKKTIHKESKHRRISATTEKIAT